MQYPLLYLPLVHQPPIHTGELTQAEIANRILVEQYHQVKNSPETRRTHHFMGRFENTYISEDIVPGVQPILEMGLYYASQILNKESSALKFGFWFNEMHQGHQTTLHSHEEEDELLSAVYYIQSHANSGDLVIINGNEQISITPRPGNMVLFKPELPHRVEMNNSDGLRLSVAMNFGPR